ncbi:MULTISPECIES: LysR family transcriptional regulator [unclassified Pseudomonas]|uniref:LysR family transcriptional regulator n=1 Tax=unclassified Pseudomonas TaxID=196821 RepID=UPI0004B0379F|nr:MULTISPECIES: LysR family transcriptional regulator [unclassified Pseudomonas]SMF65720.1 transcriptional regulator, LysR family [Pseudomonas sp. LAMO17WK12:I1]
MTHNSAHVSDPATPHPAAALTIIDPRWALFARVVAAGSLSKAAVLLDMPQSMVSRNIALLESQCGERLFHRTGRGVVLTEFGEQLLPGISGLLADAEGLADDIRNLRGKPVGEVVVGMLPSAVRRFAGTLFSAVREQMPGVRLHLIEGASAQLEEQLHDGRLDMALVLRESEASIADAYLLARLPLHLVGPAVDRLLAHREIALKQLAGLPLVVPGRPHLLRARLDHLAAEHGVELCVAVEADSVQLQYEVVAAGGGYAIASVLPGSLDQRLVSSRIVDPVLERFVVLVESPRRPVTRASREVRRLICSLAMPSI